MFVVVENGRIKYCGTWQECRAFLTVSHCAGDKPVLRRVRTGEAAAFSRAIGQDLPYPQEAAR